MTYTYMFTMPARGTATLHMNWAMEMQPMLVWLQDKKNMY